MHPGVKYALGRVAIFVVVVALLWPVGLDPLLTLMLALLVSMGVSYFLLKRWRDEASGAIARGAEKRREEKERLRAALAGDDEG
ncbi:DUF4229 domain-containing protein [Phytomonospora endophytica]|uniref:DUF4229 domain-containing protein n=1 Tax=Phytomonospora endophytica TaxID=714109 RepID=A0A841FYD3_9ACTN|nr:DUF4229 domain-containing protein [Phytomonospora endophytica]MBB6037459.1 hypothetical protein [Phytomonospora endophytica]GIG70709.1 hypothetical protein Pen01_70040 [Phytomonospora endophytica]